MADDLTLSVAPCPSRPSTIEPRKLYGAYAVDQYGHANDEACDCPRLFRADRAPRKDSVVECDDP